MAATWPHGKISSSIMSSPDLVLDMESSEGKTDTPWVKNLGEQAASPEFNAEDPLVGPPPS